MLTSSYTRWQSYLTTLSCGPGCYHYTLMWSLICTQNIYMHICIHTYTQGVLGVRIYINYTFCIRRAALYVTHYTIHYAVCHMHREIDVHIYMQKNSHPQCEIHDNKTTKFEGTVHPKLLRFIVAVPLQCTQTHDVHGFNNISHVNQKNCLHLTGLEMLISTCLRMCMK